MIMENLGDILMAAGLLLAVTAVLISMKKSRAEEGNAPDMPDWTL